MNKVRDFGQACVHFFPGGHREQKLVLMRPAASLHIPQPCHESWDAMTPAAQGRHCAGCQKTVVDFTHKTDAEILALLAGAAGGRTCGRFAAGQLGRPLQRAAPAAPTAARWRTWLAAAGALWGLREGVGTDAKAQAPVEWRARYWGGPAPAELAAVKKQSDDMSRVDTVVRGVVLDSTTHEGLPGVTVLFKGTTIGVPTDASGQFRLTIPAEAVAAGEVVLQVNYIGYVTEERRLAVGTNMSSLRVLLQIDVKDMLSGAVVVIGGVQPRIMPPAPWHPRRFYHWGKYWLTRPFQRS
jgi:hypothetical protein